MTTQVHDSLLVTGQTLQPLQIASPTTGSTVNITPTQPFSRTILTPAGTLTTLTLVVTNGAIDGQHLTIFCKTAVGTLTMTGTFLTTALAVPTNFSAGQQYVFVWSVSLAGWVRVS